MKKLLSLIIAVIMPVALGGITEDLNQASRTLNIPTSSEIKVNDILDKLPTKLLITRLSSAEDLAALIANGKKIDACLTAISNSGDFELTKENTVYRVEYIWPIKNCSAKLIVVKAVGSGSLSGYIPSTLWDIMLLSQAEKIQDKKSEIEQQKKFEEESAKTEAELEQIKNEIKDLKKQNKGIKKQISENEELLKTGLSKINETKIKADIKSLKKEYNKNKARIEELQLELD